MKFKFFIFIIAFSFILGLPAIAQNVGDDNFEQKDLELLGKVLLTDETNTDTKNEVYSQTNIDVPKEDETFIAVITRVVKETTEEMESSEMLKQVLEVEGLKGKWKGVKVLSDEMTFEILAQYKFKKGDKVVVVYTHGADGNDKYYVIDHYRTNRLFMLIGFFALLVIFIARCKGFKALIGLGISFVVIFEVMIPLILAGYNALFVAVVGSLFIIVTSFYLIHGYKKISHVSTISTILSLGATGIVAVVATNFVKLSGYGEEEALYLVGLKDYSFDVRSILLSAIIIGVVGILDDVIINQVSVVKELQEVSKRDLTVKELYKNAMDVGINHMSSMVNTLVMAYTGSALALFILFSVQGAVSLTAGQIINGEMISTEILRMIVSSIGILLAVPISTYTAAFMYSKKLENKENN